MFVNVSKAAISQLVDYDEIGMIFGVVSSLEIFSSIAGSVIFIYTYIWTADIFAGMTYLIMTGVFIVMIILVIVMMCIHCSDSNEEKEEQEETDYLNKKLDNDKSYSNEYTQTITREE